LCMRKILGRPWYL